MKEAIERVTGARGALLPSIGNKLLVCQHSSAFTDEDFFLCGHWAGFAGPGRI